MPLYSTDSLEERAASIADKETEKQWRQPENKKRWGEIWLAIYHSVLEEFN